MPAIGRKCLAFLLTAAMLLSLVGSAAAETRPSNPPPHAPFSDTYGTKYGDAVDALYELKVVNGKTPNAYEPQAGVTRAEMAALIVRALGETPVAPQTAPFPDVAVNHWAAPQIAAASDKGIVKGGTDGFFRPGDPVTYPQVVAMIIRALGLEYKTKTYPTDYVLLANELKLIEGLDWGLEKPASRGDVAVMLYRAIFNVPHERYGKTLSQVVFKRAGGVRISPETNALPKGTTRLTASVVDWVGNTLDGAVSWSVAEGAATIDQSGNLRITGDTQVRVLAEAGGLTASRTFTVISSLSVSADKAAVGPGGQTQLQVVGKATDGTAVAVTPFWSILQGDATVTAAGLLTVQGSSAVTVRAQVGSMTADQVINVVGGLILTPSGTVYAAKNSEVKFEARITDGSGKTINAPVTWSIDGNGTIDQNGKLRTGNGPVTVTARAGGEVATASVRIVDRIEVSPGTASFAKNTSNRFTAQVYSTDNQPVPGQVTWSVEPKTIGFFDADGSFYAKESGSGAITAQFGGVKTQIPLTIAGQAVGIRLTASPSSMPANGTSTSVITARLVDGAGNTASGPDTVFFSISHPNLGTLDKSVAKVENGYASVTLTAGTASGSYNVVASAPGYNMPSATMSFTTTAPVVSHIALEAYPNPLAADSVSQTTITATLVDTSGAPMVNNTGSVINVNLFSNNTAAGTLSSGNLQIGIGQKSGTGYFVSSSKPGTTVVSGTSSYSVRSTTITSQVVGGAYQLRIREGIPTARADGISDMPIYVEVLDANGNIRTGENSVIVAMSATSGSNNLTISSQQTRWGIATFRLRTSTAGEYTVNVWSLNTGLQTDSEKVTFTAGAAYKLALSVEPNSSLAADGQTQAKLTARVLDVNNNLVTDANHEVRFVRDVTSSNVLLLPSVTSVRAVNGQATLTVTATTGVGTDRFTAQADGLIQSPTSAISTRITGIPIRVAVQSPREATIASGNSTTVQVWVLDQLNQLVTGDNGRMVTLVATNGAEVSPPVATVNGVATFTVTATRAGGVGLTALVSGINGDSVGRVLNVAPNTPDHIILSASPEALSADGISRTNISAKLVDKYGNTTGGSVSVTLSLSSTEHVSLPNTQLLTGGSVQLVAKTTPGTTTITGTSGGYVVMPLTVSTYRPGNASRIAIDQIAPVQAGNGLNNQVVVKARILDENGNLMTSLNTNSDLTAMALRLTGSGGSNTTNVTMNSTTGLSSYGIAPNGVSIGSAMVSNGVATFTVTNTKAETITLTPVVYYRGVALPADSAQMVTQPGPAASITVGATATAVSSSVPSDVVVTAKVTDIWGNPLSTDDTITFTASTQNYVTMPSTTAIATTNGAASITVQTRATNWGGTTIITAHSRRLGIASTVTLLTDLPPDRPTLIARDNNGVDSFITSGETAVRLYVTVPTRVSNQEVLVYVNGVVVPTYSTAEGSVELDTVTAGSNGIVVYIKRADLGGLGLKEIRALVQTPLGLSALSEEVTVNVQN